MTSTLTITTTVRLNGTVVQCRGVTESRAAAFNRTLHIAGAPMLLFVSIVVYAKQLEKKNIIVKSCIMTPELIAIKN